MDTEVPKTVYYHYLEAQTILLFKVAQNVCDFMGLLTKATQLEASGQTSFSLI